MSRRKRLSGCLKRDDKLLQKKPKHKEAETENSVASLEAVKETYSGRKVLMSNQLEEIKTFGRMSDIQNLMYYYFKKHTPNPINISLVNKNLHAVKRLVNSEKENEEELKKEDKTPVVKRRSSVKPSQKFKSRFEIIAQDKPKRKSESNTNFYVTGAKYQSTTTKNPNLTLKNFFNRVSQVNKLVTKRISVL